MLPGRLSHHQKEKNQGVWAIRHNEYGRGFVNISFSWFFVTEKYLVISCPFTNVYSFYFPFISPISAIRCADYSWQRPDRLQWLLLLRSSGQQRWSSSCHATHHLGWATSQTQIHWFICRYKWPQERLKQYFWSMLRKATGLSLPVLLTMSLPCCPGVQWLMGVQDGISLCLTPLLPEISWPKSNLRDIFPLGTMLAMVRGDQTSQHAEVNWVTLQQSWCCSLSFPAVNFLFSFSGTWDNRIHK